MVKEKESEEKRKFPLELRLREKIIGQEAAIATVSSGSLSSVNARYNLY